MIVNVSPFRSESGFKSPGFLVTPNGDLLLDGSLQADNLTIDLLSASEILIQGISVFDFSDSGVSLSQSVTQSFLTKLGTLEFLDLQGNLDIRSIENDQVLKIQNGKVRLTSITLGSIDNVVIGQTVSADGYFKNVEALNLTIEEVVESQQVNTIILESETIIADIITTNTANIDTINADIVNTNLLSSTVIETDTVSINLQPTEVNHATRKDYVDTTATALAIALGA